MKYKRLVLNTIAILVIAAVAFLAYRSYSASNAPKLDGGGDLPSLRTLKIVDATVDPGAIQVAIDLVKGADEKTAVADFLEIYKWGRTHFGPIKCGPDYPLALCQIGEVRIYLLKQTEVPSTQGPVLAYAVIGSMGLDQVQIDVLLNKDTVQPATFDELVAFHKNVADQTAGTGGYIQLNSAPLIFTGLK